MTRALIMRSLSPRGVCETITYLPLLAGRANVYGLAGYAFGKVDILAETTATSVNENSFSWGAGARRGYARRYGISLRLVEKQITRAKAAIRGLGGSGAAWFMESQICSLGAYELDDFQTRLRFESLLFCAPWVNKTLVS